MVERIRVVILGIFLVPLATRFPTYEVGRVKNNYSLLIIDFFKIFLSK